MYWRVRIWDQNNEISNWSKIAFFEIGLLHQQDDWQAQWINPELETNKDERYPASYIHKPFVLEQDIQQARLYITAAGLYEGWLNGNPRG